MCDEESSSPTRLATNFITCILKEEPKHGGFFMRACNTHQPRKPSRILVPGRPHTPGTVMWFNACYRIQVVREKVSFENRGLSKRSPRNDQVRKGVQESSCWESCTCATLTPPKRPLELKKLRKSSAQSSRYSRCIESGFPLRAKRSVEATQCFYPKAKGVGGRGIGRYSFWIHTLDTIPPPDS